MRPLPDKLLAEWFWTDRWMGSSAFLLPQEARGVYREMLTQAWRRGACLPNDHEAIQRATGTTDAEWSRSWPQIKKYWRVDGECLVNDTQRDVYAEATRRAVFNSTRAKHAASTRWSNAPSNAPRIPPSPSPSPSPDPSLVLGSQRAGVKPPPRPKGRAASSTASKSGHGPGY